MKYTDGKLREKEEKAQANLAEANRKLASLLDQGERNPFGTMDAKLFEERLERMALDELGMLCAKAGIRIKGRPESDRLRAELKEAFEEMRKREIDFYNKTSK